MLAREAQTSEDFAAVSETATATAQAIEVSDSKLIAQVLTEERERLALAHNRIRGALATLRNAS